MMKRTLYGFILAVALGACAPQIAGNELGGTIEGGAAPTSPPALFPRAEAHCAKYGKKARVTGSQPQTVISYASLSFDCI